MKHFARRWLSPAVARAGRAALSYPRFWIQRVRARRGQRVHGHQYGQHVLFVAGLPKSGTSWIEGMLAEYPGFEVLMPPEAVAHELRHQGSHGFDLPTDLFDRLDGMLGVLKLHVHGSPHNVRLLREQGCRYVVMHRDLRDVAVSYYYYVRATPWHPEHPTYVHLDVQQGLRHFADTLLGPFVDWVDSWRENGDPLLGLTLRYEELLENPETCFADVARHFGLNARPDTVRGIVERHSFRRRAGRIRGVADEDSFFRKGVAGDWRNHFTPELERLFEQRTAR